MDTHYRKKEDRSGVRLISLLGNHLKEILKREADNRAFIHLYCTGPYWVAFEKSAYLLRQISSRTLVTPLSLTTYPFPIVMVSWTDGELRSYTRNHLFRCRKQKPRPWIVTWRLIKDTSEVQESLQSRIYYR